MFKKWFDYFETRIDPYPENSIDYSNKSFWTFITSGLKNMGLWMWLFVIFNAGMGIWEALMFQFLQVVLDWMGTMGPAEMFSTKLVPLLLMLLVVLISPIWELVLASIHFQTLSPPYQTKLRWAFHRHMLGQSLNFFENEFSGRVSARIMQTTNALVQLVMNFIDNVIYLVIFFSSIVVILVGFSAYMLIPFGVWAFIFAMVMWYFIPRISKRSRNTANKKSMMLGRINDTYANIPTVKLFSHTMRESAYAREAMDEFMRANMDQNRLVTGMEFWLRLMNVTLIGGVMGLGMFLWSRDIVSVGVVAASGAMTLRLVAMSHWIMWQSANMFENVGTIRDGMDMFARPIAIVDKEDAKTLEYKKGEVAFEHMDFKYVEGKQIFTDFNLAIASGEKIGLVGRSGAGKSTLVNLLLRFFDVTGGKITIDGQDVRDVTQVSLRSNVGMVTQDTSLLHRSVFDNIAYGRPDATMEEVVAAAKKAKAHDFITELKDAQGRTGYDAQVGERGVKLSGGQRQRVAISRVILKNAPILLLDEATSALDSEVEEAIQESLNELMENKTVIAIAHRLSTIAKMDRLVVLDEGKIVEMGTHDELIAKNGLYAKLWRHQSGGFLPDVLDVDAE